MDDIYKKDIEAYVDKELDSSKNDRMEETIKSFPTLEEYENKVRKQNELLKKWWDSDKKNYH